MFDMILSLNGVEFLLRWIHFLAGITWIGLLYYFNFVQGEWFKTADATVKSAAIRGLVPRALLWFRWGAMFTFLSGLLILGSRAHQGVEVLMTSWGLLISIGAVLGTLMFLNVWLVIWPNQKIVMASATLVAEGKSPLPEAPNALARAGLASRSNVMFSIPMLFFMGAASHLGIATTDMLNFYTPFCVVLVILALLEWNALKGKMGPMASVKGVVGCGVVLTAILYGVLQGFNA